MKKEFSFYEFTGVLLPGTTLLFGLIWLFPNLQPILTSKELSLGSLGLFVIAAYLSGHLIQSVGNILEYLLWMPSKRPTHWITWKKVPYIGKKQLEKLPAMLKELTGNDYEDLSALETSDTDAIGKQLNSTLKKESRTERIEIFNGNYGMFRGIAASAFTIAVITLFVNGSIKPWANTYIALVVFAVACYRCYRFGKHYASEIYSQSFSLYQQKLNPIKEEKKP